MNWLDKLKIALLQSDEKVAFALIEHLPPDLATAPLDTKLQALELISQTKALLASKQMETRINMEQIRAAKKFLEIMG